MIEIKFAENILISFCISIDRIVIVLLIVLRNFPGYLLPKYGYDNWMIIDSIIQTFFPYFTKFFFEFTFAGYRGSQRITKS